MNPKAMIRFVYPNGSMQKMVEKLLAILAKSFIRNYAAGLSIDLWDLELQNAQISRVEMFRSQDIPVLLECGAFDIGIVGRDSIVERAVDIVELESFAMSRQTFNPIRLVLAAPKELGYRSVADLPMNAVIATEYPETARYFIRGSGRRDIKIQPTHGQTEQMVGIGAADAVLDITETGRSLEACGLEIVETVSKSVMTVSANKSAYNDPKRGPALRKFAEMLKESYHLMLLDAGRIK